LSGKNIKFFQQIPRGKMEGWMNWMDGGMDELDGWRDRMHGWRDGMGCMHELDA